MTRLSRTIGGAVLVAYGETGMGERASKRDLEHLRERKGEGAKKRPGEGGISYNVSPLMYKSGTLFSGSREKGQR